MTIKHVVNISVVPPGASSAPPLANTGTTARSNLQLGFVLLGAGLLLLALGVGRRPQRRRQH